jgi:RNA polymerase sigma-70 factor (ECF subfamily)
LNLRLPARAIMSGRAHPLGRNEDLVLDRDLVEAARRGDREAYVDLIRPRFRRLFAIAQRILRDVDRADDALQETLVIAWRDLRSLRDPDRFDGWLTRVLVNECTTQASRERRRVSNLRVLPVDEASAPDSGLLTVVNRDQLERGFRRLTPDQRAILVLRHYAGRSMSEIAEVLGISPGTVRSRLHHAHRAMRAAVEADGRSQVLGGRPA